MHKTQFLGECMIDSKANDISYDNEKTLAEFINYALQIYSNKFPIPDSATLNRYSLGHSDKAYFLLG
jgi:hypothetical protein